MAVPQMTAGAQDSAWLIGTCVAASRPQGSSVHSRFFNEPLAKAQQTQNPVTGCTLQPSGIAIGSSDVTIFWDRMALKPFWQSDEEVWMHA